MERFVDRITASIHLSHWFKKNDPLRIDLSYSVEGFETFGGDENMVYFGEPIQDLEPYIVSGPFIIDPGIS
jgi:hypothetical protein